MRNIDEILAEAKGKRFDRLQPHTHETRAPVEQVAEIPQPKAAPSVKERKSRKISTRGLLLLLVLGIATMGAVIGLASTGTSSTGTGSTGPTGSSIVPNCSDLQWSITDVNSAGPGSQNGTWSGNYTATKNTDKVLRVTDVLIHKTFTDTAGVTFDRGFDHMSSTFNLTAPVTSFGMIPVGYSYQTENANFTTTFSYIASKSATCTQMVHFTFPNGGW